MCPSPFPSSSVVARTRQLWLSDLRNAAAVPVGPDGGPDWLPSCNPNCLVGYGVSGRPLLLHAAFDDLADAAAVGDVVEVVGFALQQGGGPAVVGREESIQVRLLGRRGFVLGGERGPSISQQHRGGRAASERISGPIPCTCSVTLKCAVPSPLDP
jgi:hypothetical protein